MSFDKIKGVSFTINNSELTKMELMPEYATVIRLYSIKGQEKSNIHYPIKHPPSSFNSWQQLGRIMILIQRIFKTAKFEEVESVGSYVYTLDEFASFFTEFVEMPKPYYPQDKTEYLRHLTFYAQRLHFKGMLNAALLNAMAIKFNVYIEKPYSTKEVYKKASSVYRLNRTDWKISTGRRNTQTATERRTQLKKEKIAIIASHIEDFTDEKNALDINALSQHLGIPVKTIYRLRPQTHTVHDHSTTRNEKIPSGLCIDDVESSTILQDEMRIEEECERNENEMRIDKLQNGVSEKAFKLWCDHKGKSYSAQAKKLSQNKLKQFKETTQLEMVEAAIMNGWKGLFEVKQTSAPIDTQSALDKVFGKKEQPQSYIEAEVS